MNLNVICVIQIILGTHAAIYTNVLRSTNHDSVIGNHLKDEHNVRPSNLRENFTILKKCRSKLECLIFERKERNWTLKRTRFARNFLFKFQYTLIKLCISFFTLLFLYIYLYVKFFHIPLLIMMTWSHRNVTYLSLISLLKSQTKSSKLVNNW